jgi:hypothetical protein
MALDAQRPLLDFAELDAVANHGMVIEGNRLAQTGDVVRHLFSQSGDIRGQFVDAFNVPIKTRVYLLEAPVDLLEAPVDLFEPPVMLTQSSDDIAYLLGDFGQQLIDGCDIGLTPLI